MAKRAKKAVNSVDPQKVRDLLDEVHEITDKMESDGARARSKIGKTYDAAATELDISKTALKKLFRKERRDRKDSDWAKTKADKTDRDSLMRLASALGDDSPLGKWASETAGVIPEERPEVSED